MKSEESSDRLQDEAALRQRNLIYPDTIRNEAEGYRRLLSTRGLSRVERSGSFIIDCFSPRLALGLCLQG